jgi:NADP-dependent 3-hydroxy acid dehydrogenase YdfG
LDGLADVGIDIGGVGSIHAQFLRFVYLDQPLAVRLDRRTDQNARLSVFAGGLVLMTVTLRFGPRKDGQARLAYPEAQVSESPNLLDFQDMDALSGRLTPPKPPSVFGERFPKASAALGEQLLADLAQTSTLVGMVCPGLNSIYNELLVYLLQPTGHHEGVSYKVVRVDERYRRVNMDVVSEGFAGKIIASVRAAPVEPPNMEQIARHVSPGTFKDIRALIVGGSRGLGAITAKILASGGARVTITYAQGLKEAQALQTEIIAACGAETATICQLDVSTPVASQLGDITCDFTHLYYFATPKIFVQKAEVFASELYARYSRFYVEAFHELCLAVMRDKLSVLYPSSIAVEARPKGMTEYSMAKIAGELLCEDMSREINGLKIWVERLPRILTDQTATVAAADNRDALETLLPIVRATASGG